MATRTLVNTETRLRGKRDHYTSSRSTNAGTVGSAKSSPRNNVDSKTRRATASPGKEDVSGRTNAHSRFTGQQNKNSTSEITSRGRAEERTKGRKNSKASDGSPVSVSKLKNLFDKTIADEQEKAKSSFRPVRPHSQFVSEKTKKSQDSDRWSLPSYAKKSGPPSHKIYVSEGILAKRAKFAADSIEDIALKTHSPRLSDLVPDFDLNDFNKDFRSRSKSDSWIKPLLKANTNADKSRSSSAGASERVSRDDSFSRKAIPKHRLIKSKSADTLDVDDSVFESELGKGFSKGVKEQVQRHRNKVAMGRKGLDDEKKGDHQPNKLNGSSAENAVRSEKKKYVIINKSDDKENNSTKTKKKEKQPWERESGVVKRATWFDEEISDSEKTMELESVHLDVKVEQKTESRSSDRTKTVQSAVNEKKIEKEKKEERQPGESHSEVRQKYKTEEKPKYVIEHKTDIKSDLHVESKPKVEIENKIEDKFDVQVSHSHTDTRQEPVFIPQKEVEDEEDAQSSGDESDGSMVEHSSQEEDGNFYSFLDVASNLERKPTASVLVKEPKKEKKVQKVGFSEVTPQVCATYSPLDYERGNDLIDPVTASAEWELEKRVEKMDVFSVDLDKDNKGLGLSIIGLGVGTDTGVEKLGIFVKSLTGNGAAEKDGRIQVNDQIIEVDGVSLVGVTQQFAAQTLKHTSGTVRFLMGREKGRLHHMKSTDSQLAKEIEDLKTQLQQAEERASKAEEKAKDAMNQVASLKADAPKTPKSKATKDSKQVSKLEEQLKKMTEAVKESETDLALSEAENQDLLKQLEESKGLYLILEKKYQTKKNKLKEQQERDQAVSEELTSKDNHIKSLENQVRDLQNQIEELRKSKNQTEPVDKIRSNDMSKNWGINGNMQREINILKKSQDTEVTPPKSHKEVTESEVKMRNISQTSQSPRVDDDDHRFSYVEGDSLFPSEWKDPTKLDLILDWQKTDEKSNKKERKSSGALDLSAVPETNCLNNDYSLDKIRIAEQQDKKYKPTRASYGKDLDDRDQLWKASPSDDEDKDKDEGSEGRHQETQDTKPIKPSGPGLFLPKFPEGGFKLKPTGRNLKDDSDLSKQQSSHEMTRSSFPIAGRDQTHGIVVENLLDKQLTKADVKVSSLPSAFGQEDKTVNKLSDSQDSLDASHNSLQEIEEAKRRIDSDLNSSMASSRGSSPFLPPAMPLLEVKSQVYNEAAVDVPPDFENIASSPSDESLHGGSLEIDSGSIDSRSVGSSNAVTPTTVRSPLNQWSSRSVLEWEPEQVGLWLIGLQMDEYCNEFSKEGIDGKKLVAIDNSKFKAMGVKKEHRTVLKKNIKQLKLEAEKEQKAKKKEEKEQKSGNLMTKGIKSWKGWKGEYTVNTD